MPIMSRLSLRSMTIILSLILTVSFALTTEDAFADKKKGGHKRHERVRHERHEKHKRYKKHKKNVVIVRPQHRHNTKIVTNISIGPIIPRRHRRVIVTRPRPRPGKFIVDLPSRHTRLVVRGRPYYYRSGLFYYRRPRGYVVVGPPIGAIVPRLAIGFSTVWVGGSFYYYYGNVFYRRVPTGYVVVDPPRSTTVVLETPAVVQPAESASGRVSVIAPRLNVRTGPSLSNPILYQVKQNTTLRVHGRDSEWLYVELSDGKYGWVMEEFTVAMDIPAEG